MQPDGITALQDVIQRMYGCEAQYSKTVHVREPFAGAVSWDGFVTVFRLIDFSHARHCYAWNYQQGNETRTAAILEIPPVNSPENAVKIAVADPRPARDQETNLRA